MIFAHGSSVPEANQTIARLAEEVARTSGYNYVRPSFLEMGEPDLITAVAGARQAGIARLVVVPYFLTMGIHLRRDLPKLIDEAQRRFPEIEIRLAESLDGHPLMAHLVTERAREALARFGLAGSGPGLSRPEGSGFGRGKRATVGPDQKK